MLTLNGLTKDYGSFRALDGLSLSIGDGELHGFVGPNGAGKSTTMKILSTLLLPSGGTASICGADVVKDRKKVRLLMGYMPDFFGVYDKLKAWEYLDFYARCYGFSYKERQRMISSLLSLVSLSDKRDVYVDVLSRGMKQRLCLARALIHDPKLLILDEPASGMDPRARAEMKDILRELKSMGKSVLISSHILPELSEMCDSLTIIDHGKLVFTGSVSELSAHMEGRAPLRVRFIPGTQDEALKKAAAIARQMPGVTEVTREEENLIQIAFNGEGEQVNALLRLFINENLPIMDFHRPKMNLEKVFMEVTNGD